MGYSINVDVGGTFMDFYVSKEDEYITTKVPTTSYELGVGFMKGLEECAAIRGETLENFLKNTDIIKYCTTMGTNVLVERKGPKLGLITTRGFEDTIFIGRGRQWADGLPEADLQDIAIIEKPVPLIPRKLVVGVRERIDYGGNVVLPLSKEDVLEKIRYLIDNGVRGVVISLLWSFVNPSHERKIREIIEEEFPEIYLGNMPIILSSEISPKEGEYLRTMTAIVNTYIHIEFAEKLSYLCSELIDAGYKKPLLLVDNKGGCAKSTTTKAVNTYSASPVSGLCGSAYLGKDLGLPNIVFTDVGGTTFDIAVVVGGAVHYYDLYPTVDRWRTQVTAIRVVSIGAGGGSIAWLNKDLDNRLEVGPRSAGAIPGPACYDLGGEDPTVTDADVVLGYVNPDYYLGGKIKLNKEKAIKVIKKLGEPLGWDEITTAMMIKRVIDERMGQETFKEVAFKGHEPSEFVILAGGGAGPTHCCGVASAANMRQIIVPPISPVAGAFGASTLDVVHTNEKSQHIRMFDYATQTYLNDFETFNSIVKELSDQLIGDVELEGFKKEEVSFRLELEMRYGLQWRYTVTESPLLFIESEQDVIKICDHFTKQFSEMYGPEAAFPQGGIECEIFRLSAYMELPHTPLPQQEIVGENPPKEALKREQMVLWDEMGSFSKTNIYEWDMLQPGNIINGPAIIEAKNTTVVVEPDWTFNMTPHLCGMLTRNI